MLNRRYSLTWFQEKYIDLLEISPREDSFQDFIVYPMIDALLSARSINDYEIVDSKNFRQFNTKEHDRRKYSVLTKAVPDMLIAKNFYYRNRKQDIQEQLQVKIAIEIKEPNSDEMLNRNLKGENRNGYYKDSLYLQIIPALLKNGKAMLTNLRRWQFFDITKLKNEVLMESIREYVLIQELCGFDCIDECYNRNSGKRGMPVYVPTYDSLKKHRDGLCNIGINKATMRDEIKCDEEIDDFSFKRIQEKADLIYLNDIKEALYECCIRTIDLMSNKGKMVVNRAVGQDVDLKDTISCVSDLKLDAEKWDMLLKYMNEFI